MVMKFDQPGRPGTLTAEETQKLKEMWVLSDKFFGEGLEGHGAAGIAGSDDADQLTNQFAGASIEEKKKKGGLFGRKKTTTDEDGITPGGEDKYNMSKDFKEAVSKISPEDFRYAFWAMVKSDHVDTLLLRFLRARKWDVNKAFVMAVGTLYWRSEVMYAEKIMAEGEYKAFQDGDEDFLFGMRKGKSFIHGQDKQGRPVSYVSVHLHHAGDQTQNALERFTIWTMETGRLLVKAPIDNGVLLFDLSRFGLRNMDYGPVKFMIKSFEAYYPESLGLCIVYKAPWIFQACWQLIKGWLDPVVAQKIVFCKNTDELEQYIDATQLPAELGGDSNWEYNYIEPKKGENARFEDTKTRDKLLAERKAITDKLTALTYKWALTPAGPEFDKLNAERELLINELAEQYWRLDPYVRARGYYDRIGLINDGGKIDFSKS